jgi:Spy/CpxP family protein refolding chaperone
MKDGGDGMQTGKWLKRFAIGTVALLGVLALGGVAHAKGRGWHDPARMEAMFGKRLDRMLDFVQATPEQRTKIVAIKDGLVAKHRALRDARKATRDELLAQWDSVNPDMSRVHARIDDRAKEMTAFAHDAADAMNQVHAILTPEQRAKLSQRWKERGAHGHRGDGPPPPPPAQP